MRKKERRVSGNREVLIKLPSGVNYFASGLPDVDPKTPVFADYGKHFGGGIIVREASSSA